MRNLCTVTKSNAHLLQLEKAHVQQGRPSAAKKKKKIYFSLFSFSSFSLIIFKCWNDVSLKS